MSNPNDVKLYQCLHIPDGDWKDIFDYQAIGMTLMDNVIIRSFNSLLYYSSDIQPGTSQFTSFLRYAQEVCLQVHRHHSEKETIYFPFLESKLGDGRMAGNVVGHEAIRKPLAVLEDYVGKLLSKPHEWDPELFSEQIHRFMPILREHLKDEIETLNAAELRSYFTEQDFKDVEKKLHKETTKTMNMSRGPQLVFVNGDGVNGAWYEPNMDLRVAEMVVLMIKSF
ncbi:hypothetical protein FRB90_009591 [Tulasnella sp. 427]|nr:hypothetical protein FRB90_009591 [Tulasnella sp. 427]